jgi:MFS family permease
LPCFPLCPIPHPFSTGDFSFLLAADTFAHGRLANPTPAMWTHFESIHIAMQPTYSSMYFPGPGLAMAAGKVLFGNPWYAILIAGALMCAAICWMLQAWLPPSWALLGGVLAVLRLALFSYWTNTYTGGSWLSALGGALVLGALPRLMKTARFRYAMLMAAGIVLLGLTRPYEGLLLSLPVAVVLGRWLLFGKNRPSAAVLLRGAAAPLALIAAAVLWLGYYDYRAFGSPFTLPYTVARNTYAIAPYYIWQPEHPIPNYRHEEMRRFYIDNELVGVAELRSWSGFIPETLKKFTWGMVMFFAGTALLPPLVLGWRVLFDRRLRFLVLCFFFWMAGMMIGIFLIPHYLAPFTAAFYALGLQAMRHLRAWKPEGKPGGLALVRLLVTICVAMAGLRAFAEPLHLIPPEWPGGIWINSWVGPGRFGGERARVEARLEQLPGSQLAIVRYSPVHEPMDEWVYNAANIDSSKVIWAREMDAANNLDLIRYYKDRQVWLVQPDAQPAKVSPYAMPEQAGNAAR